MIVKNERRVILNCLASVKPIIDSWVIVDTGSTDGTQQLIREFLKDIPGELYERPWVDFSHNRNEALAYSKKKGDYSLLIDADEKLIYSEDFRLPQLTFDYYYIPVDVGECEFLRNSLIDNRFDWQFTGVIHEIISSTTAKRYDLLRGVVNSAKSNQGGRSQDKEKYLKDAQVLEKELLKDPGNGRYVLHLAGAYVNAKDYERGLKTYRKRGEMGGFSEEVFYALLQTARLEEFLKKPKETFVASYQKAYAYRPTRAEPLYYLARYFIQEKNYAESYKAAKTAIAIPQSPDSVLVERWIYDWGALYAFIESCFHLGKTKEMVAAMEQLLLSQKLPDHLRKETEQNLSVLKGPLISY
jgi:glycosyltransferase involved in cell wall biosynthesis